MALQCYVAHVISLALQIIEWFVRWSISQPGTMGQVDFGQPGLWVRYLQSTQPINVKRHFCITLSLCLLSPLQRRDLLWPFDALNLPAYFLVQAKGTLALRCPVRPSIYQKVFILVDPPTLASLRGTLSHPCV